MKSDTARKILVAVLLAFSGLSLVSCSSSIPTSSGSTMTATPNSLSFGMVPACTTSAPQVVTVTNTGTRSLTISSINLPASFTFAGLTVPRTLSAGGSVGIQVTFAPTSLGAVPANSTLTITSDAANSPATIALSADGSQPNGAALCANTTSLNFSNVVVGKNASQTVTLTNFGTAATTITAIAPPAGFSISGVTLPLTLAPGGGTATLSITFAPTSPVLTNAAVTIVGNVPTLSINVSGVGIQPQIAASPSTVVFGQQTANSTSVAMPVTVSNPGTSTLNISGATTSISQFSVTPAVASGSPVQVAPLASTTFNVTFTPDSATAFMGQLTFTSDAPTSPTTVQLTGTGTTATAVANLLPSSLNFEGQALNTTSKNPMSILVTNGGTSSFNITGATTGANSPFAVTGFTPPQQLKPQSSFTLNLTFDPTSLGPVSGMLSMTFDNASLNTTANLSGIGINVCDGISFSQSPAPEDVTTQFTTVASGLSIVQVTSVGANTIPDVGIPSFSALTYTVFYNGLVGNTSSALSAAPDGSGSQLLPFISGNSAGDALFGPSGRLAAFPGPSGTGKFDIFADFLVRTDPRNISNACTAKQITALSMTPGTGNKTVKISQPVVRPDNSKEEVVFAPASAMRRVEDDGTLVDGDLTAPGFDPPDKYQGQNFTSIRLNPKAPSWVLYNRAQAGTDKSTPELWLFNFDTPGLCTVGPIGTALMHPAWSPDGTTLVAEENVTVGKTTESHAALISIFSSIAADGTATFATGVSCPPPPGTPVSGATIKDISTIVEKNTGQTVTADFCDFPQDGSPILACTSGEGTVPGPSVAVTEAIYLLAQDGSNFKFLTSSDAQASTTAGTPIAVFAQDSSHILFRSDKTGTPQVYILSGFTPTVP